MEKLCILAFVLMSSIGFSQNYFTVSVGYGLGLPGESAQEYNLDTNYEGTARVKNLNLGGGINATVSYGIDINENLALDLELGYQNNLGASTESMSYDLQVGPGFTTIWVEEVTTNTIKTSSFRFAPSLRYAAAEGQVRPFLKVGPQVVLANLKTQDESKSANRSQLIEEKFSTTFSVGAIASAGAELEVSENLLFFASLNASLAYYAPTYSEIVTNEVNGQDMLGQLPTSQIETQYYKELNDVNQPVNQNEPSKRLKTRVDYSSVGLSVGVRVLL